ncbi:allantoate permease [Ophiostoma piceae UAMH 11346]|uniref:Allantoate permease n=1 Tax=Ophiostoma piceae (strain UAMH 11346) TaxID=1262450 RepID=S3C019_OPHP1|nr:allantoate permease [Ophiostoma piceae UAMH 11346]
MSSKSVDEKDAGINVAPSLAVADPGKLETQMLGPDVDIAAKFLAGLDPAIIREPISAKEARAVLWKLDLHILPVLTITIIVAAIDKVIISNASIYGMLKDNHMTSSQFSWVASIFYFAYLGFEWPAGFLVQKLPIRSFLAAAVFGFAVLTFCTGATTSFASLAAVRFLLGAFESMLFPTASIITAMWWTRKEQPIRVAFYFNTLSSVVTGLLAYGVGHSNSSIAPWRLLFIILGCISTLLAVAVYVYIPSSPVEAWWLTDREKFICIERIRENNTGVEDKTFKWYQAKECLMDPKPWLLALFAIAQNICNGGLVTFAAIIVSGLGFSTLNTTLIGVPTGVIGTIWQIMLAFLSAKLPGYRCGIIFGANLFPIICAVLMFKLRGEVTNVQLLGAYYGFYSYWAPYVLSTSLNIANVSGHTKKITANAMFFIGYCVGNIIGPQVFRAKDAPDYKHGYMGILASLVVASVCIVIYGLLCRLDNMKRDKKEAAAVEASGPVDNAFSDKTDKEKRDFRYHY